MIIVICRDLRNYECWVRRNPERAGKKLARYHENSTPLTPRNKASIEGMVADMAIVEGNVFNFPQLPELIRLADHCIWARTLAQNPVN